MSADPYATTEQVYRLLLGFAADPGGAHFAAVVDDVLTQPHLRDVLAYLVGFAYGGVLSAHHDDDQAAFAYLAAELAVQRDLARLSTADLDGPQ